MITQVSVQRVLEFIRKHQRLTAGVSICGSIAVGTGVLLRQNLAILIAAAIVLCFSYFAWGYSTRAREELLWKPLTCFSRRQYAEVWDELAGTLRDASVTATGAAEEQSLRYSAADCLHNLLSIAGVQPEDSVLEIGCGVGRIGRELCPHCRLWTGADISGRMLAFAAQRLSGTNNARLVQLREVGLGEFDDGSFDVVYATNMLAHLDEMDRWRYVQESFRVLRPGGRILLDNIDIESEAGWKIFEYDARRYQQLDRPPYMPRFSTASELVSYARRAGFDDIKAHPAPPLVIVRGTKRLPDRARAASLA
jgi:ubiquinone/menaquinone biosynthesis C-methylase UbiE